MKKFIRDYCMKHSLIIMLILSTFSIAETNIKTISIQKKLTNTLQNVKKFKKEKNTQIANLNQEINTLRKEFISYQLKKEKEIKKINQQLKQTKKALSHSQQKIKQLEPLTQLKIQNAMEKAMEEPLQLEVQTYDTTIDEIVLPMRINLPWVEIMVEDNIDIYQLALLYYGDVNQYTQIYAANKNIISNNFKVHNGMILKIPITSKFREQPMVLNTH